MYDPGGYDLENDVVSTGLMGWEASGGVLGIFTLSAGTQEDTITRETHNPVEPRADFARDTLWLQPEEGVLDSDFAGGYFDLTLLQDGDEVIIATVGGYAMGADANNDYWCGLSLNNNTASFEAGAYKQYYWDGATTEMGTWDGVAVFATPIINPAGADLYYMVRRIAGHLYITCSLSGRGNWVVLGDQSATGPDKLWFFARCANAAVEGNSTKVVISPAGIRWARHRVNSGL